MQPSILLYPFRLKLSIRSRPMATGSVDILKEKDLACALKWYICFLYLKVFKLTPLCSNFPMSHSTIPLLSKILVSSDATVLALSLVLGAPPFAMLRVTLLVLALLDAQR